MEVFESRASILLFKIFKKYLRNKKILLPLNICPIVPIVCLKAEVNFDFIDINLSDLCMNQEKALKKIEKEKIDGILFARTFGVEIEVESFFRKLKELNKDLFIIDDRCLMIPSFDLKIEESYADLILYSTGYVKYVDIGWGGYGYLKNKFYYPDEELIYKENDFNSLMKELQFSINNNKIFNYNNNDWLGSEQIMFTNFGDYKKEIISRTLPIMEHKNKLNNIYKNNIPFEHHLGEKFNIWRFSILIENKEKILNEIFKKNLFASSHYKEVDYLFKKEYLGYSNAKKISERIINLFNDFRFDEDMAFDVCKVIKENL